MYLAHISEDDSREQSIEEHLRGTAELAGSFASFFDCREWGYGCGLVHDIGKYSESFQRRLCGGPITDHATAGAQELYARGYLMAAYCVAGHHAGLPDGGSIADTAAEATLSGRMKKQVDDYKAFEQEIAVPEFHSPPLTPIGQGGFSVSFFIRMLFSCLVDADFLDTEKFMKAGKVVRDAGESMDVLLERLRTYVQPWLDYTDDDTVNGRRTAILKACFERGNEEQGVFQLTVPTGGGKTLSSLAFALQHARCHHLNRIIYVIPYTSIIEQNAGIFKDILGSNNVLEDHCNAVYENPSEFAGIQLATENWDKPIIVTTNVQFFESLFSNKTSRCRKLHRIAGSVIIFDEAQMLPTKYLKPCVQAISELVCNYHSTAVLCTATQPSLQVFFPEQITLQEICPDRRAQYEFFKRTALRNAGELSDEELVRQISGQKQVLCILNSRKRVQKVYEALHGEKGIYHLSTLMYPAHRKRLLQEIRMRLKAGESCRLIATSLVEAGVDLDFMTVYRELAGVDSVVQAAGRCNREGRHSSKECETIIFTLPKDNDYAIPNELKLPIAVGIQTARVYEDLTSPEAIGAYFEALYHYKGEGLDDKKIVGQMEAATGNSCFPFATVARQFRLIENDTKTVLINVEEEAEKIAGRIRYGEQSRQLIRDAGQYCVNIYDKDFESLNGAGCLEPLPLDFYLLRDRSQYTAEEGLTMRVSRGEAVIL